MSIIHSFDKNPTAIINPADFCTPIERPLQIAIATFSHHIITELQKRDDIEVVGQSGSTNGSIDFYRISIRGREIGVYLTRIGASASAATLEEAIATLGIRKVVVFGSSGILDPKIVSGKIIVPTAAYRDEGTSYHYAPPADYIALPQAQRLAAILTELGVDHVAGKVWTTDAFYRETLSNVQ
ncbi:MAG: nucleoside phosphorylase, partial [bacterium]